MSVQEIMQIDKQAQQCRDVLKAVQGLISDRENKELGAKTAPEVIAALLSLIQICDRQNDQIQILQKKGLT